MGKFTITTDNMADLPDDYVNEHELGVLSLTYMIDGETYDNKNDLPYEIFYNKMRKGSMPTTSQINPEIAKEELSVYLEAGMDILHIAFSSGLSGSYNSTVTAIKELREEYPERTILAVDSLGASLGQGLLVHMAVMMKKQGKSIEEIREWTENHKLNICHNFTVYDLFHLYRGGRVSKSTAVLGTVVGIKPIMHIDEYGKLVPCGKVRGRKRSLITLVDNMEQQIGKYRNQDQTIFISHGDCMDDAEYLKELVKQRFGYQTFLINRVGPTIGAHSGPGTLALFYMGEIR